MKMTKAKRLGAVIVLTILPLFGFSKGLPFLKVSDKEAKVLTLRMATDVTEKFKVSVKDNYGQVLFTEYVTKTDGYMKSFDLKNLKKGEYQLEMKNDSYTVVMPVFVENESVEILRSDYKTINHKK